MSNTFRHRLRACVWLALVAAFGLALGPTISRVVFLDAGAAQAMPEHCVDMAMAGPAHDGHDSHAAHDSHDGPSHSTTLDCCGLCFVAASAYSAPAEIFLAVAPPPASPLHVALLPAAPLGQRELWSSAAPRGPPHA